MKIMCFHEFAKLPPGAIFSYYEPCNCRGLYRKGETLNHNGQPSDYFETEITPHCENGGTPTVEPVEGRWGAYEWQQQYAVLEAEDIEQIKAMLTI